MVLRAAVASLDGREMFEESMQQAVNTVEQAEACGAALGKALKQAVPSGLLEQLVEE